MSKATHLDHILVSKLEMYIFFYIKWPGGVPGDYFWSMEGGQTIL